MIFVIVADSFGHWQGVIFSAPDALGRLPLDATVRLRINGSSLPDTNVHFQPGDWRVNMGSFSGSTTSYVFSGFMPLQAALQQVCHRSTQPIIHFVLLVSAQIVV